MRCLWPPSECLGCFSSVKALRSHKESSLQRATSLGVLVHLRLTGFTTIPRRQDLESQRNVAWGFDVIHPSMALSALPNPVMAKVASPGGATALVCSETHLQRAQSSCRPEAPWVVERGGRVSEESEELASRLVQERLKSL